MKKIPVWGFLVLIPLVTLAVIVIIAARMTFDVADPKVLVPIFALTGVVSASFISAYFSSLSLKQSKLISQTDVDLKKQLAEREERHKDELAEAAREHERNMAEATREHDEKLAEDDRKHQRELQDARLDAAERERLAEERALLERNRAERERQVAQDRHAAELGREREFAAAESARVEREHTELVQRIQHAHETELENTRHEYKIAEEADKREYAAAFARISDLVRAAFNTRDSLTSLAKTSPLLENDDMLVQSNQTFLNIAPLFSTPPSETPTLPDSFQTQLRHVRILFIGVMLTLSENKVERGQPANVAALEDRIRKLNVATRQLDEAKEVALREIRIRIAKKSRDKRVESGGTD